MSWLCQCGNGNLIESPPQFCGLCGFDLWAHFGIADESDFKDREEPAIAFPFSLGGSKRPGPARGIAFRNSH